MRLTELIAGTLVSAIISSPVFANDRLVLQTNIAAAIGHDRQDKRRSVDIDGCTMTTYLWRNEPNYGWTLWSALQFAMEDTFFVEDSKFPGHYFYDMKPWEKGSESLVVIGFRMREGSYARAENSILRETKHETQPSPRGNGTSHYFTRRSEWHIVLNGPSAVANARIFTEGYRQYVSDYCTPSS
jgi:hypothetical protein